MNTMNSKDKEEDTLDLHEIESEIVLEPRYDLTPAPRNLPAVPRPYKFTEKAKKKILTALQMGHFLETAAAYGGITKQTLIKWLERGLMAGPDSEGLEREFFDFTEMCNEARANSKVGLVAIAWRHAREDGKLAIQLLEKLFPEEYGKKTTQEVRGKIEHEHTAKVDYSKLSDEELEQAERLALKAQNSSEGDVIDAEILEEK